VYVRKRDQKHYRNGQRGQEEKAEALEQPTHGVVGFRKQRLCGGVDRDNGRYLVRDNRGGIYSHCGIGRIQGDRNWLDAIGLVIAETLLDLGLKRRLFAGVGRG